MRIVAAEIVAMGGPLRREAGNARVSWRRRDGLLLRLTDEEGRVGQGEASPLPGYSPDTIEQCRAALRRLPPPSLDEERPAVEQLPSLLAAIEAPAARYAVETALLDLAGQRAGQPLHALLGARAPGRRVPVAALLDGEAAEIRAGARRAIERGVRTLKLKIGRDFPSELALLHALRDELGAEISLRLDANGSLPFDHAAALLDGLAPLRPEFVEEPVDDVGLLSAAPVPIALDESLRRPWREIAPLLHAGIARTVVLKPTVLGGLLACLDLARRARALGAGALVGHAFEGPVAMAAAAALAQVLPESGACGLDRHAGLDAWPPIALPFLDAAAVIATDRPGLGLDELGSQ